MPKTHSETQLKKVDKRRSSNNFEPEDSLQSAVGKSERTRDSSVALSTRRDSETYKQSAKTEKVSFALDTDDLGIGTGESSSCESQKHSSDSRNTEEYGRSGGRNIEERKRREGIYVGGKKEVIYERQGLHGADDRTVESREQDHHKERLENQNKRRDYKTNQGNRGSYVNYVNRRGGYSNRDEFERGAYHNRMSYDRTSRGSYAQRQSYDTIDDYNNRYGYDQGSGYTRRGSRDGRGGSENRRTNYDGGPSRGRSGRGRGRGNIERGRGKNDRGRGNESQEYQSKGRRETYQSRYDDDNRHYSTEESTSENQERTTDSDKSYRTSPYKADNNGKNNTRGRNYTRGNHRGGRGGRYYNEEYDGSRQYDTQYDSCYERHDSREERSPTQDQKYDKLKPKDARGPQRTLSEPLKTLAKEPETPTRSAGNPRYKGGRDKRGR